MDPAMPYDPQTYDDLEVGARFEVGPRIVERADIDRFARVSGDHTRLHTDEAYARQTPLGGLVAHGALSVAAATGLCYAAGIFEGTVVALKQLLVDFERPVRPGDGLTLRLTVAALDERPRADSGRVVFAVELRNQDDKRVLRGRWTFVLRRDAPAG